MSHLTLFTDGSVNVKKRIGVGAYLAIADENLSLQSLPTQVVSKQFEHTSSTQLELQTLLWALGEVKDMANQFTVYTDSQNIVRLPERRQRLEANGFKSKQGALLNNHELYRVFYSLTDSIRFDIIKIKGHKPSKDREHLDRHFALVDRTTRKKLREISN